VVKKNPDRDAHSAPAFEHDSASKARAVEVTAIMQVWVDTHCPDMPDTREREEARPSGSTSRFGRNGVVVDVKRLQRIDSHQQVQEDCCETSPGGHCRINLKYT
jgi:hypothetical protein